MAAATLALASANASAAIVYGDMAAPPGVYFSHGTVPDGNFQVGTDNGVELGIRARNRQTFALIDGSTGVYRSAAGGCAPSMGAN